MTLSTINTSGNTVGQLLTAKYKRTFRHEWRVAIVSLFSYGSFAPRAIYTFLKECGFDTDLIFLKDFALNRFDMPTSKERSLFINLLKEKNIQAVGLSVTSPYMRFATDLTRQIHQELDIPVIWGGIAATVTPSWCLAGEADYVVLGEGEETAAELITALATSQNPDSIKNLCFKKNNTTVTNPLRPLIQNLDSLPILDYRNENKFVINSNKIKKCDPAVSNVRYEMIGSRGCPYKCTYCSSGLLHDIFKGLGPSVRYRSVEHVIKELELARGLFPSMKSIWFMDEVFGNNMDWLRMFADMYSKRIRLPFECLSDPRSAKDETIKLLKKPGVVELNIGIQTGSEKVRYQLYKRKVSSEKILKLAQMIKKHDLVARYDIITDNPFETRQDKRDSLDLLLQLPHPFILNLYSMNFFPKTEFTEYSLKKGVITEDHVAGKSDKCMKQWTASFDFQRSKEDHFWNALFSMTSKWFIPRSSLRWAANLQWGMKHPLPFIILARFSSMARLFVNGFQLLFQGRINLYQIIRFSRKIGGIAR